MRPAVRLGLAATGVLVAAFALPACGGPSDRAAIEEAVVESAMSDDPEDCERLHTEGLLEQASKQREPEAREYCEEQAPETDDDPDSVVVEEIAIDSEGATAVAAFEGGLSDGQAMKLALVEEGGRWKIDELLAFVEFDRAQFMRQQRQEWIEDAESPLEAGAVDCLLEKFEELSTGELEALVLTSSMVPLLALARGCIRAAGGRQQA